MNQQTNKQTDERPATDPSGYRASNAGGSCIGAEEAAANATVLRLADKPPTGNGGGPGRNGSIETQQATRDGRFYLPAGFTRHCDQCGAAYVAKRDTSRFCSSVCRVAAHRARHEAGEGRAGAAVAVAWLVAIIGLAWFLAPLVSDLASMRPRLAQGAAELGQTAVNQVVPIAPARLVVATPTLAPAAMATDQAATAVPDIAVTFTDSTGCQDCGTVVAAPWQVTPADPSPSGAELLRIEAAGRVWELTPARLVDCINAQQNGQPTGPTCPPNAATYAGMLGQGR